MSVYPLTISDLTPEQKPYRPVGGAAALWRSADPEVLICGPVGTGKTRAGCEKLHACAERFAGARFLMVRQTRHSLASTALVTLEEHVMPVGHPAKAGARRENRYSYHYPNGSEIVLGGMDDTDKFMSGEYDMIYFVEATDGREEDVEQLSTRLRNGVMPFQQFMYDCNPRTPNHWLKKRTERGLTRYIASTLRDNPRFWDESRADYTLAGRAYLKTLEGLSGVRRARLIEGKWAAPEGARFEGASREVQGFVMKEVFPHGIPTTWPRWLSGDYGKADPYCSLWHTIDPNGCIWTYLEDYERGYEADQQAQRIVARSPLNDARYESMHMDGSMWNPGVTFGGHHEKGPAASQYAEVFKNANEELGHVKFGPLIKGAQNRQEEAYVTLDSRLRQGTWKIERGCLNLWREIEDAVHYQDPKTGVWHELINPMPNRKDCDDHALEAAGYGIHKRAPVPRNVGDDKIDMERVAAARSATRVIKSERRHRGTGKAFGASRNR